MRNRDSLKLVVGDSPATLRGVFHEFRLPAPLPIIEVDTSDIFNVGLKRRIFMNRHWASDFNHDLAFFMHAYARLHTELMLGRFDDKQLSIHMAKWGFALNVLIEDSQKLMDQSQRLLAHLILVRERDKHRSRFAFLFRSPKSEDVNKEQIENRVKTMNESNTADLAREFAI
jgi:hypothetical protein